MLLIALGFTLEIVGILCFVSDQMGIGDSSFAAGLTLFCPVASVLVMKTAPSGRGSIPQMVYIRQLVRLFKTG